MPTFERAERFRRDFESPSGEQQAAFRRAVARFVEDLQRGGPFRKGLRIKGIQGAEGIFEMTWAKDGRATFQYGKEPRPGEPHIVWRRVGTHDILSTP